MSVFLFCSNTNASVTLDNTRILIDKEKGEKTVRFTNSGGRPVILQITAVGIADAEQSPFFAMPPMFRISPNDGQTVKVKLANKDLPLDRESLFYMDYMEIPAVNKEEKDKNNLYLLIKSRVKVIVRPTGLSFSVEKFHEHLSFSIAGSTVIIKNSSPFYANLRSFYLTGNSELINYPNSVTVPPFGESRVDNVMSSKTANAESKLIAMVINDFGADEKISVARGH
ncbi:gram-negative pili assembly chaperone (plasmid) [Serratia marcescens]|nr:gram-negative pili assembly chaperone [Serratia marcescens]